MIEFRNISVMEGDPVTNPAIAVQTNIIMGSRKAGTNQYTRNLGSESISSSLCKNPAMKVITLAGSIISQVKLDRRYPSSYDQA